VTLAEELKSKISEVKQALAFCNNEKDVLQQNLTETHQQIKSSFQKHVNTLQCRVKWLTSHGQTICHLKEGSLNQQIAELEHLLAELKGGLEEGCNISVSSSGVSLQPCESGELKFRADDEAMEEWIVSFGEIEGGNCLTDNTGMFNATSNAEEDSEDGIEVVGETIAVQEEDEREDGKSMYVEMELKSVEMQHLTPQSVRQNILEDDDFEKVEVESAVDVVVMDESSHWLMSGSLGHEIINCVGEDDKRGADGNPWIKRLRSSQRSFSQSEGSEEFVTSEPANKGESEEVQKKMVVEDPQQTTDDLDQLNEMDDSKDEHTQDQDQREEAEEKARCSPKRKHGGANLEHLINLFIAPNSKYLRLDGALCSLNLNDTTDPAHSTRNNKTRNRIRNSSVASHDIIEEEDRCSPNMRANISHFNNILNAPVDGFLARPQPEPRADPESRLHPSPSDMRVPPTQILLPSQREHSQQEPSTGDAFNVSSDDFIALQSQSEDGRVMVNRTLLIQPTDTLTHMCFLQNNPDEMFILRKKQRNVSMEEGDMCEWLRSTSTTECNQCDDLAACKSYEQSSSGWVKTATDW